MQHSILKIIFIFHYVCFLYFNYKFGTHDIAGRIQDMRASSISLMFYDLRKGHIHEQHIYIWPSYKMDNKFLGTARARIAISLQDLKRIPIPFGYRDNVPYKLHNNQDIWPSRNSKSEIFID